jgi:thymidylate synthase (FAD)
LGNFCTVGYSHRTLEYAGEADVVSEAISVDDIARRFMSRNEFSGRYSVMPDLMYVPQPERVRGKSATNKQGSGDLLSAEVRERFVARVTTWHEESRRLYDWAVEEGIANELARIVLPPTQYTRLQLKGSLLSWLKFLALRLQPDVQWESREYARAIAAIVQHEWPKCWQVFCKHTLGAAKLSADEVAWLKENVTDLPEKLAHKLRQATLMLETYS